MRRLLAAVFVILALFAVSNVYAGELSATKCTVTAGKTEGYDTILVSGEMNAAADDLSGADNIQVTVDSNDMDTFVQTFPRDANTYKNGKYKCSKTENSSKTSFTFDTKTLKFSFTAKTVDLSGLSCPLTVQIEIGDYNAETEVDEAIVNGPKSPIPIKLMMGIKNVLRVDSYKVTQGKKLNSDQLTVKGAFAVEDTTVNMANEEFVVTLGEQTFTLPAGSFEAKTGQFTCSKADVTEGGIASATFNFTTGSFTMTIKNVDITSSGDVEFCVEFADFSECVPIVLPCTFTISPTAKSFTESGGDGSVTVTTSNECDWTATSHASWIIITSGSSGSGSGTVGYSVVPNGGTARRTGTMTISGHTFTVTQATSTADIPSAPTGVTASAGDGQVSISWSAVSDATSYNIYWSTTSGVTKTSGTKIADTTSPYSHTGLTNGTTYYYVVTAVNSAGESAESSEVSAAPTGVIYSGGPIRIQSDDQFTPANGVVGGSGTQAAPYIIEGWTIDASSCDTSVWPYIKVGIIISETSKYFVIRNCHVENASGYGVGISLSVDVSNGSVQNCVVGNSDTGIELDGCSNVVISGNTIENCGDGISNGTYSSDGVTISNNTITGCTDTGIDFHYLTNSSASGNTVTNNGNGIEVFDASACTISNNIVQGNTGEGIDVGVDMDGFENNIISNNDTSNNGAEGIYVTCSHNTISHNTSNGNGYMGIRLDYVGLTDITASNNMVSNNTASSNGMDGLYVGDGCVNNTISDNTCLSNNTLGKYSGGQPLYHDISINARPNTLDGNIYVTSYIY